MSLALDGQALPMLLLHKRKADLLKLKLFLRIDLLALALHVVALLLAALHLFVVIVFFIFIVTNFLV